MDNTIDMQDMRHLNLFGKVTRINTMFCFQYNDIIIFCVPKHLLSKAIGKNGRNVKKLSEVLRRKIRIIPVPKGIHHARPFIETIVSPVMFKDLEVNENEMILTAGSQSKAALIGRNKRRLLEMQKIVKSYFGKEFKIQ